MEGIEIKYQIKVHLPVEIPQKIYGEAARLFSDHLEKFFEEQLCLDEHLALISSSRCLPYTVEMIHITDPMSVAKSKHQVDKKK